MWLVTLRIGPLPTGQGRKNTNAIVDQNSMMCLRFNKQLGLGARPKLNTL
ncbi:predicted protein [Pyrenophora tritici-repentis Pt-1C-BFP]|uniref:Uncharacterized protein n=1 Tax=Pyrenophora tritici-repentis (strain Pt-1C-BFP) TaxID=426418 RepID=B2VS01_PYRTR|nr:uncharacterized protein PTRG_00340 [Pyrenophora tritici-repentis Pt-1C-BFP]EDU39778.1 predicted protein [Pyrenophora tritici-repentis Pt-1C-BFP]